MKRTQHKPDTPIVFGSGTEEELYCNLCNYKLKPIGDGFVWQCTHCGNRHTPTRQDVRRETVQETIEGPITDGQIEPNAEPVIGYAPEPSLDRKKIEYKGGFAELAKKGTVKITSYKEGSG